MATLSSSHSRPRARFKLNCRRRQSIFLTELDDDDSRKYLRVSSAVAPITGIDARRALLFNWQQRVGYLALSELDSVPYLHLCENRPYTALDGAEIDRLIEDHTDPEIVDILNERGHRSGEGGLFTVVILRHLKRHYKLRSRRERLRAGCDRDPRLAHRHAAA